MKRQTHPYFRTCSLVLVISAFLLGPIVAAAAADPSIAVPFQSGKPIWPTGRETEMNLCVGFRTVFDAPAAGGAVLRLAGSSKYRVWLNGRFLAHGPARGPHGYYRVDEIALPRERLRERNLLAIEVAGYNVNSYYLLDQPAFLQAEVTAGGRTLAGTAGEGRPFTACILDSRLQKVQRYSFQRTFTEFYRLTPADEAWKKDPDWQGKAAECAVQPEKNLIVRRVAYPDCFRVSPSRWLSRGTLQTGLKPQNLWKDRSLVNIGPKFKGYPEDQLELTASNELQTIRSAAREPFEKTYRYDDAVRLDKEQFAIAELPANLTGFIGAAIRVEKHSRLYVTFDEVLRDGDVDFKRLGCVNAVGYELAPGTYRLESFEPYTLRYMKFNVLEGDCVIKDVYLREYACSEADGGSFACSSPQLNRIFEAARQTFRQNSLDIFMDCPSRERAGWLCDSFFTARVALDLTGNTTIEKNFLENYLLPASFAHLPEGMLPMCYPADHNDEIFIPNWAMWFVVELEEYLQRSGDRAMVDALKPRIMKLLDYFKGFENESGLLEKLEKWVFIEWSAANQFTQDVNYPSNMLYARVLEIAGRLYGRGDLSEKAARLRKTILDQSWDGDFFVDNAVRKDGKLTPTRNRTEICQYYAFYFGLATPKSHPRLWSRLRDEFGPERKTTKAWPEIHMANAFIGNYLRFELLSRYGDPGQIRDEMSGYFLYMADRTGTLWENTGDYASCNHGFASHVAHVLYRDVLGLYRVHPVSRTVTLHIDDVGLDFCRGSIPTPNGPISLAWERKGDRIEYRFDAPAGWMVEVEPAADVELVRAY